MSRIKVRRKKPPKHLTFIREHLSFFYIDEEGKIQWRRDYCQRLPTFAYHAFFADGWVVFHAPTGTPIETFKTFREARVKCKKLEAGLDLFDKVDMTVKKLSDMIGDVPF